MCVCLPQHPWLFIFFSRGHDRQSSDQNFSSRGYDRQSSEQNIRKLNSLQNNGEDDKHAHRFLVVGNIFRLETYMNSLVKVLPYSKMNFEGKIFFTQNWCNITFKYWPLSYSSFIINDHFNSNKCLIIVLGYSILIYHQTEHNINT